MKRRQTPRVLPVVAALAFGMASSRCTPAGHGCAPAPRPIASWSSGMHVRRSNDRADLEAFLAKHPSAVNAHYGVDCWTPLHSAARFGREDLAPTLIARGADASAATADGTTALALASNDRAMETLIRRHAKP